MSARVSIVTAYGGAHLKAYVAREALRLRLSYRILESLS